MTGGGNKKNRERIVRSMFRSYYAPKDGRCTQADLSRLAQRSSSIFLHEKPAQKEKVAGALQSVWVTLNANIQHKSPLAIAEDEFVHAWLKASEGRTSVDERDDWFRHLYAVFMCVLDANHDGKVSKEEWCRAKVLFNGWSTLKSMKYFNEIDSNQDGWLDPGEVKEAINAMFFGSDIAAAHFCPPVENGL